MIPHKIMMLQQSFYQFLGCLQIPHEKFVGSGVAQCRHVTTEWMTLRRLF